jgi:hypothetical protein
MSEAVRLLLVKAVKSFRPCFAPPSTKGAYGKKVVCGHTAKPRKPVIASSWGQRRLFKSFPRAINIVSRRQLASDKAYHSRQISLNIFLHQYHH